MLKYNIQSFEYARVLNMPDIVHSLKSLHKLLALLGTEACSEPCQTAKTRLCESIAGACRSRNKHWSNFFSKNDPLFRKIEICQIIIIYRYH